MLRIHFTAHDLANTRIAGEPDPLWELSLSAHQLRLPGSSPFIQEWKRDLVSRLHPSGETRRKVALTLALSPPHGYFPDFLTPLEASGGFDAGLQAVLITPKTRLHKETSLLGPPANGLCTAVDSVRRGTAKGLNELGTSMRHYHQVAIAPMWKNITGAVHADRDRRARDLIDGGWAQVFTKLHPTARFHNNVLEIRGYGGSGDRDLHLAGRGLLLIPSYFKEQRKLMALADNDLPPVLLYPIDLTSRMAGHSRHLTALIGRTRTNVLEVAALGATTSAVAVGAQISLPAASKHLSVLRRSGLVHSVRTQNAVHHTITCLGRNLLAGNE